MAISIPEGFELETTPQVPPGFVLESMEEPKPFDLNESITGLPTEDPRGTAPDFGKIPKGKQDDIYEGFIKPTVKAIPRVLGATAGSLALLPGAGVAAGIEMLPRISSDPSKPLDPGSLERGAKAFEDVMGVPLSLIETPEQVKGMENIAIPMKLFEMAGEGWRLIGKAANEGLKKLGFDDTYIEPLLATYGEAAAMFAIPGIIKGIRNSTAFRKMTIPERGVVVKSLADAIKENPNMTQGEIIRKWNNPSWREEALKARGVKSVGLPETPLETKGPIPEHAAALKKLRQKQLPAGQGFELKTPTKTKKGAISEKTFETEVSYKPVLAKSGKPYKTRKSAQAIIDKQGLSAYEVVKQGEGFALQKRGRTITIGEKPTAEQALKSQLVKAETKVEKIKKAAEVVPEKKPEQEPVISPDQVIALKDLKWSTEDIYLMTPKDAQYTIDNKRTPADIDKTRLGVRASQKPAAKTKEPYEIGKEEYVDYIIENRQSTPSRPSNYKYMVDKIKKGHKEIVEQALSEGKPVPAEVLKEYPDLAKQVVSGKTRNILSEKVPVLPAETKAPEVSLEKEAEPKIGKAWINEQQKPIMAAREIKSGKKKGMVEVTLIRGRDAEGNINLGKKIKIPKDRVINWPDEAVKKKATTLYSGLDPAAIIDAIKKTKGQYQTAKPYLEEFGRRAYQKSKDFKGWSARMKSYLGDMWDTFKHKMKEVWKSIRKTLSGERGALGDKTTEQILRAKLKKAEAKIEKIKTSKEILKRRRKKIRNIRDYFNLTDTELKKISGKDIRLMDNFEFNKFVDRMEVKAEEAGKKSQAINELQALRKEKMFISEHNIRKLHKLPIIKKMTTQQLNEYINILEQFEKGDQFLSPKRVGALKNTLWEGSKTMREVLEKASAHFNEPISELKKIKVLEGDRFRYDTSLARRNPFYNFMVDEIKEAESRNQFKYFKERDSLYKLGKAAIKSMKRGVLGRLVPRQKKVMAYMEAEVDAKLVLAKTMTSEEIKLAEGIADFYRRAYNWLLANQDLKYSRFSDSKYVFHAKRPISELIIDIKDTGIKGALKDILHRWKLDEANFKIVDSKTGEVLAMKKFFRQTLYRTGELTPSKNIIKSTDIYMQQFFRKMAIDESVVAVETLAMALRPKEATKTGLLLNDSLMTFVKEYLNNKKGRTINFGGVSQGGKIDTLIRFVNNIVTLKYIALNIPLQAAAIVGETTAKLISLGNRKMIIANARKLTPRGRRILKKYKAYTGEGVLEELFQPARNIGENINMLMYGLFKWSRKVTRQDMLLGNMTRAEFLSETISNKKLAEIDKITGRWVDIGRAESIIGSTSPGKSFTKFRQWAIPIVSSTLDDMSSLVRTLTRLGDKSKRLKKHQIQEFYRIAELGVFVVALATMAMEEDRETFLGRLRYYATREVSTFFNAISPRTILTAGVVIAFLEKLSQNLYLLVTMEKYKRKEGYKGVAALKKQFTPTMIKQFQGKEKSRQTTGMPSFIGRTPITIEGKQGISGLIGNTPITIQ